MPSGGGGLPASSTGSGSSPARAKRAGRAGPFEGPRPAPGPPQQAAEAQPREVGAGDGYAGSFELAGQSCPRPGSQLRVDVDDRLPVVLQELDGAVDDVAQEHGPLVAVGDDNHG